MIFFYGKGNLRGIRAGVRSFPEISNENATRRLYVKEGRETFLKPSTGQDSLHQDSNDNGVTYLLRGAESFFGS